GRCRPAQRGRRVCCAGRSCPLMFPGESCAWVRADAAAGAAAPLGGDLHPGCHRRVRWRGRRATAAMASGSSFHKVDADRHGPNGSPDLRRSGAGVGGSPGGGRHRCSMTALVSIVHSLAERWAESAWPAGRVVCGAANTSLARSNHTMPIANLLTALSNDLGPDPIPAANVRTAFDRLFGAWRNRLDGLQPTQQETEQFITLMMRAVQAEAKPRSNARLQALTKLRVFNATPGQIVFSEMDPHVVAFQLALRIREPALIDQSELGLCGGNSLMVHFARKSPEGYAEYAISLLKTGSGKFHSMDVAPSLATKWGWFTGKMAAADIVALGSLGL